MHRQLTRSCSPWDPPPLPLSECSQGFQKKISKLDTKIHTRSYPDKRIELLPCELEKQPVYTTEFGKLGVIVYVVEDGQVKVRWEGKPDKWLLFLVHGRLAVEEEEYIPRFVRHCFR